MNNQFEVYKPNGYTYDVLAKQYTEPSSSGHLVLSHHGFYKGDLNENKIKNGQGTFLFPNSIYSGQWNLDKKEGDGTLIILKPQVLPKNQKPVSKNFVQQQQQQQHQQSTKKSSSPNNLSPRLQGQNKINSELLINKMNDKFNQCEELIKRTNENEFLKQQDYYSGKWINGKANGIGCFHFEKDDSNHYDFWRYGVVIRYANQQNILKPLYDDSVPAGLLNSKEILKEMMEDWKSVVVGDDDFPCARPYLTTPTTSISINHTINQLNNNNSGNSNGSTSPVSPSVLSPTHIPLSPPKVNTTPTLISEDDNFTPGSFSSPSSLSVKMSSPISSNGLQHSKTQPNVSQSQQPSLSTTTTTTTATTTTTINNNNNNKLNELIFNQRNQQKVLKKQLLKSNQQKQSYGIITANYLKSRLENEEKFFMTLILFISKWEIPFKSFNIPNNPSIHASFLIFVPDTDNCTFISLSNLIMQSNILERLIFKLLIDPMSKVLNSGLTPTTNTTTITESQTLGNLSNYSSGGSNINNTQSKSTNSSPNKISPSTSLTGVSTITTLPSSTPEERELHKLLPICLDLDETPSIERECIAAILNIFKVFPTIEDYQSPQFIPDIICKFISCFKKTRALENHLLQKQFQMSKDYFFKIPQNPNQLVNNPIITTTTANNTTTTTIMSGLKTLKRTKVTPPSSSTLNTNNLPSIAISSSNGLSSSSSHNSKSPPVTSPPTIKPSFSVSLTTSNKIDISTSNPNGNGTKFYSNNTTLISNGGPRRQTLESIFPTFKQQSNTDLLTSLMRSTSISLSNKYSSSTTTVSTTVDQTPPELTLQSLNILLSQFKQSYQFPESINLSFTYLTNLKENIVQMEKIIQSKIIVIQETKSKQQQQNLLNHSSFNEYLSDHDYLIDSILINLKNDLSQLKKSFDVCLTLYKEMITQQIHLVLRRLKYAHSFINQLIGLPQNRVSKLPKDFIVKFIKHTHRIVFQLQNSANNSFIKLADETKIAIDEFVVESNDLFSKLPNGTSNGTNGISVPSPLSPTNQSPPLSSISSSVYEYFLGKKSSSSLTLSIGQQSNNFIRSNSLDRSSIQFEPSDITPGPFSFISPLDKIIEEIMSGHYQLILPVASSGDELLVSVVSLGLADLRSYLSSDKRLKDMTKSSLIQLFNILLHSTVICHNINSYFPEVFKTLILLLPFYPKKDELFVRYKEIFIGFMELCVIDESCGFSFIYLQFLGLLIKPKKKGLRKELKKEFVELFPIQLFIDIMEKPIVDATNKNAEKTRAQAAQILINLSISSIDYLLEVKSKNALAPILDICKFGQAFAHTQIEESELQILQFLGEGALAEVHKGIWKGKEVAVKIFNEGSFSFRLEDFLKEVAILGLISHPNLLKLKGACIAPRSTNSTFMIVTELMHKGTLLEVINKNKPLPLEDIIKYAISVAQGLAYLHSVDFIHRDIKAANILVDKNNNAKVGDFGLSRVIDSNFNMTAVAGTPKWESPECLMGDAYTSASDVYSYGMMLFELATGEEPFMEIQSIVELARSVCEKKLKPKIPNSVPSFISSLIKDCLHNTPKKRPTMNQIIQKLCNHKC
ncbi:hypothetical protein RB653_006499 [Dictyostelium firmibasis]|uniref:Protein kinase domain-containing protein n=1 Tax=Dictyostelium firmibasis TaxID=79012 RepID=A0AAN7YZ57_9MYCE